MVAIKISGEGMKDIESGLLQLPFEVRGKELQKAVRKGGKLIADRAVLLVPYRHKRTGQDAAQKHLSETIGQVQRDYSSGIFMTVVGPQYPAGAHGHLVEHGHRIVTGGTAARVGKNANKATPRSRRGKTGEGRIGGQTRKFPFLEPAANDVKTQVEGEIIEALKKAVTRIVKKRLKSK